MKRDTLPDLPYDHSALEPHYSGQVLELHHGKHHAAYVSGANATLATHQARSARSTGSRGAYGISNVDLMKVVHRMDLAR